MNWVYSRKYWKRNTDIFSKDTKDYLEYKDGYDKNFRKYYQSNSKEALMRKIYKDYLNIILDKVIDGDVVVISDKNVTVGMKTKKYKTSPYIDVYEELNADGQIPYIFLNTGDMIKDNRDFLIIPNKKRRDIMIKFIAKGGKFTKLLTKYFKL